MYLRKIREISSRSNGSMVAPSENLKTNGSGKCEYWLHTRCLKVKARDLPDEYFCPACVGNDEIGDDE